MWLSQAPRFAGWDELLAAARSDNRTLRTGAVLRAYSWLEHALVASAGPRRRGEAVANLMLKAFEQDHSVNTSEVRRVISVRYMASQDEKALSRVDCSAAAATMRKLWRRLGFGFVNSDSALALARQIYSKASVQDVCLYGSMARGGTNANDIDLMVLDDGTYSSDVGFGSYDEGTFRTLEHTKKVLAALGLLTHKLERSAVCRWLDIKLLNGQRFGTDGDYTRDLQAAQPDPWFFVNISFDLKRFDNQLFAFQSNVLPFPFEALRAIHPALSKFGLDPAERRKDARNFDEEDEDEINTGADSHDQPGLGIGSKKDDTPL